MHEMRRELRLDSNDLRRRAHLPRRRAGPPARFSRQRWECARSSSELSQMVILQKLGLLPKPFRRSHEVEVELDHALWFVVDVAGHGHGSDFIVVELLERR